MLFSIVTVVKNGMPQLLNTIKSLNNQTYKKFEHLFVYSNSNDLTYSYIKKFSNLNTKIIIQKKGNLYDAINLGIKKSTGKYIFLLHAGDIFYDKNILKKVSNILLNSKTDGIYGNVIFTKKEKLFRIWKSDNYIPNKINYGWMFPHTSLFIKKIIFAKIGYYDKNFSIASDYDFIIRLCKNNVQLKYYNMFVTKMTYGGLSTKLNISSIFLKYYQDYRIILKNRLKLNFLIIFLKPILKLSQFIK